MELLNKTEKVTHNKLVIAGERYLHTALGCGVVLSEFVTICGEIPDCLGLRSDYTILIECKVSRTDFLRDQRKIFRQMPDHGVGDYRFYLCPENMISIEELPPRWGLLYYMETGKIKRIHAPIGNIWSDSGKSFKMEKSRINEYRILYSALRRIAEKDGWYQKRVENNSTVNRQE